jgi:hypothetical protein
VSAMDYFSYPHVFFSTTPFGSSSSYRCIYIYIYTYYKYTQQLLISPKWNYPVSHLFGCKGVCIHDNDCTCCLLVMNDHMAFLFATLVVRIANSEGAGFFDDQL